MTAPAVGPVLTALLNAFDDSRKTVITETAYATGLLWPCLNSACSTQSNPGEAQLCSGCGYDRTGKPISDVEPGLYPIPPELWEELRHHLRTWFAQRPEPTPDAVTFTYRSQNTPWFLHEVTAHYGGRTETLDADFDNTEIDETLTAIADEAEPNYGEDLRITL
ncbi:hypothetical protein [Streptomyces sp. NPDC004658]|uniref:hypothetical protein n=1 Tax=Streptomyces sp. NPDC004658 TaxID=3154672 RepID=UPI0033BA9634